MGKDTQVLTEQETGWNSLWRRERKKYVYTYEGVSKTFRTSAATYTAVVVTLSTGRW
jgi:hypothetical protein